MTPGSMEVNSQSQIGICPACDDFKPPLIQSSWHRIPFISAFPMGLNRPVAGSPDPLLPSPSGPETNTSPEIPFFSVQQRKGPDDAAVGMVSAVAGLLASPR